MQFRDCDLHLFNIIGCCSDNLYAHEIILACDGYKRNADLFDLFKMPFPTLLNRTQLNSFNTNMLPSLAPKFKIQTLTVLQPLQTIIINGREHSELINHICGMEWSHFLAGNLVEMLTYCCGCFVCSTNFWFALGNGYRCSPIAMLYVTTPTATYDDDGNDDDDAAAAAVRHTYKFHPNRKYQTNACSSKPKKKMKQK